MDEDGPSTLPHGLAPVGLPVILARRALMWALSAFDPPEPVESRSDLNQVLSSEPDDESDEEP